MKSKSAAGPGQFLMYPNGPGRAGPKFAGPGRAGYFRPVQSTRPQAAKETSVQSGYAPYEYLTYLRPWCGDINSWRNKLFTTETLRDTKYCVEKLISIITNKTVTGQSLIGNGVERQNADNNKYQNIFFLLF